MFIHGAWSGSSGWNGRWSRDQLKKFTDAGFTHFRVGVFWQHVEPNKGQFNETYLKTIDSLVADIQSLGAWAYFDIVHLYTSNGVEQGVPSWAQTESTGMADIVKHGWGYLRMLATRYKGNPTVRGFDVNEPDNWQVPNDALRFHNTIIGWIREIDPNRTYYLEPVYGNGDPNKWDPALLTHRTNVILSVHDYFMGWKDGKEVFGYDGTTGYVGSYADMEKWFLTRKSFADKLGIPIQIGEFGIGDGAARRDEWIADKVRLIDKYSLGSTWWEARTGSADRLSAMDKNYVIKPHVAKLTQ